MVGYKSSSRFKDMSTVKFIEEVYGIKLNWRQKLYFYLIDIRNKFNRKYKPYQHYERLREFDDV